MVTCFILKLQLLEVGGKWLTKIRIRISWLNVFSAASSECAAQTRLALEIGSWYNEIVLELVASARRRCGARHTKTRPNLSYVRPPRRTAAHPPRHAAARRRRKKRDRTNKPVRRALHRRRSSFFPRNYNS